MFYLYGVFEMTEVFDSGCGLCRLAEGVASRVVGHTATLWREDRLIAFSLKTI